MEREDLVQLAHNIAQKRADEVEREFFREISKKTYKKYFGKYQKPERYGGYMKDGRYYMLRKSKYKTRKVGHHIVPYKRTMMESAKLAKHLMEMGFDSNPLVIDKGFGIEIHLGYSGRAPYEYKGSVRSVILRGEQSEVITQYGKRSSLDRLIENSISEWANEKGIVCKVTTMDGL